MPQYFFMSRNMTRSSKSGLLMVRQTGLEPKYTDFLRMAYLCEKTV
nr:MAG TPA: hypothetical protein [Caudoviricetes sp.]